MKALSNEFDLAAHIFVNDCKRLVDYFIQSKNKQFYDYCQMAAIMRRLSLDGGNSLIQLMAKQCNMKVWILISVPKSWKGTARSVEEVHEDFIINAPLHRNDVFGAATDKKYKVYLLQEYLTRFHLGSLGYHHVTPSRIIKYYANILGGVHFTSKISEQKKGLDGLLSQHIANKTVRVGGSPPSHFMLDNAAFSIWHAAKPFLLALDRYNKEEFPYAPPIVEQSQE